MKTIRFTLNGEPVAAQVETHENAVELLQRLGLNGARESCAQGLCGCCTVIVDGRAISGCLYFAAFLDGCDVQTIEQPHGNDGLDAVQIAFAECGALQCGFCTPGFIMSSVDIVKRNGKKLDEATIRHELEGNICRCTGYHNIVKAIQAGAAKM